MNYTDPILREIAAFSALDMMLADIAVRVQLTPTDYQRAIDHYQAIHEWIEREDSPLFGLVQDFYTQGGFAIGATDAARTDDEFDIDVMAQLACARTPTRKVLCRPARSHLRRTGLPLRRARPTARRDAAPSITAACIST